MKLELELELVNKFPELCKQYGGDSKETCFAWGFECQDGWFDLIDETLSKIDKVSKENNIDVSIGQIKQKFGKLVIHLDFEPAEKSEKSQQEGIKEMYNIIDSTYENSVNISEISGLPGKIRNVNNWMISLTDTENELAQEYGIKKLYGIEKD